MTEEVAEVCETPAVSRAGSLARDTAGVHKTRAAPGRPPHVVIVGAGFAGLAAAKRLAKAPVDVTVIDRRNHHLFQPLLYQVATAALSPAEIVAPIRAVLAPYRNVQVHLHELIGVAPDTRRVITRTVPARATTT